MDQNLLVGLAALITALATAIGVLLRSRKVSHDVATARDKRNADLEEIIYKRLRGEIERQDAKILQLEREVSHCEEKHEEAQQKILDLERRIDRNQQSRDTQVSRIEKKVTAIQETTGTYPKLEERDE